MPTAQVTGLASGIDWQETVSMIMEIESLPKVMLEDRKETYQDKLDAWQTINTNLLSLSSLMESMNELNEIMTKEASSTDTDIATASANSSAATGSYSLEINQLAQSHILIHEGFADQNTTAVHNGPGDGTFTYTYGTETYNVTVPAGSTLVDLVAAINNDVNNPGITATILNDGSDTNPYHLVLTGETGADNTITVIAPTLPDVALDNFTLNYETSQTAQNAQIKVDGYPTTPGVWIESDTNEVSGVISGVTLNLKSTNPGSTIMITITNDIDAAKDKIQEFVNAYNEIIGLINLKTKYDEETEEAGILFGNGTAIGIKGDLQAIIASTIPGLQGNAIYKSLGDIGLDLGTGSLLTIDDAKLTEALEDNFEAVGNLFAFSSSSTNNHLTYFYRTEATQGGTYNVVANYDASGVLTSATINGNAAQIDGEYIIGMDGNPEEGLRIQFTYPGGGAGSTSAEIRVGTGSAVQIENKVSFLTDPIDGTVQYAEDGIESMIESLDTQIARWEERLARKQEQLEKEFLQMELLVGQLQSQGNFISAISSGL